MYASWLLVRQFEHMTGFVIELLKTYSYHSFENTSILSVFNKLQCTILSPLYLVLMEWQLLTSENRGPLVRYLQLLVVHHPSKRFEYILTIFVFVDVHLIVDPFQLFAVLRPPSFVLKILCTLINAVFELDALLEVFKTLNP